jgi:hypothetical protein
MLDDVRHLVVLSVWRKTLCMNDVLYWIYLMKRFKFHCRSSLENKIKSESKRIYVKSNGQGISRRYSRPCWFRSLSRACGGVVKRKPEWFTLRC